MQNFTEIKPDQALLFKGFGYFEAVRANHLICPREKLHRSMFEMKKVSLWLDRDAGEE